MMVVFREELERDSEMYLKGYAVGSENAADQYVQGIDEGFKKGFEEGSRGSWRKLFWLMVAGSFVGSLLSITAIFATAIFR